MLRGVFSRSGDQIMKRQFLLNLQAQRVLLQSITLASLSATGVFAAAQNNHPSNENHFYPGNLVVSRSLYDNRAANITVGEQLPPECASTQAGCPGTTGATNNGLYPAVFNNVIYDPSFGITSRIYLDQITPFGGLVNTLQVPNSLQSGVSKTSDQLVTSFSSKSEIGLHLSLSGKYLTFMGYVAPVNQVDVSNSNTPAAIDPTNPDGQEFYRAVAAVNGKGVFHFTETNAYSGNNGRAAILNDLDGNDIFYTSGNAGNGSNPQPDGVILGAGAQIVDEIKAPEDSQSPGTPAPVASFNVTELGDKADKVGKDDNFRGMTIFKNVIYYTKGSGSNGVNTVYFVDTTGKACPSGVGLPSSSAALPTDQLMYNLGTLQTTGLPSNMCILAGFPTEIAKSTTGVSYPFGLWFADDKTLYVADEGDGYVGGTDLYTHAAAQTTAGLQKWVFNASTSKWTLAYTLQKGLELGKAYSPAGYPKGNNSATNLPWAPASDGLRNITGYTLGDAVVVYAITSTISGGGDTGADPNKLVGIIDQLKNTDPSRAGSETFLPVRSAAYAEVLRGVALTPGTPVTGSR
jgi:hypothetical protein